MLYVTGDIHGDIEFYKLNSKFFKEGKKLTKNDYVLVCGDFACCWDNGAFDRYVQDWYNNKPWTTLFVDGNHENFDILNKYPVIEWNGGRAQKISDSIIHLMRGETYNIDGHTIFAFGGAQSHDKLFRKEGVSWWKQEMPSEEEYENGLKNLDKINYEVEYVFTHCAPDEIFNKLRDCGFVPKGSYHDQLTNYLEIVRKEVENKETFKGWYFGHYHDDFDFVGKYHLIFDKVRRLW